MSRSLEYRIQRLERAFLSFAALLSGEAEKAATEPDEVTEMQAQLGKDMKEMADEL